MASAICPQPFFHVRKFHLLVIFLLSFGGVSRCVLARCIQEHHDSLLLFKSSLKYTIVDELLNPVNFSLTFPNDSKLASWRPRTDCCKWEGVTCNETESSSPGHVTTLDLWSSSLSGNIHPALFSLTSLRSLDLSQNYFINASLPSSGFQKLTNLTKLVLSSSGFVGKLPSGISGLTKLEYIDLSLCGFVGDASDVISPQFSQLTYLNLDGNGFTGTIPESLGQLTRLSTLKLRSNGLSGSVPASIANLTQLTILDLAGNRLKGLLPMFSPSTPISRITLENNMLTGPIPIFYTQLPNITVLSLANNSLTGSIPSSFFSHPTLEVLLLQENRFSGFQGEFSDNISSVLKIIVFHHTGLQGQVPQIFDKMPQLEALYLNGNNLTGSLDLCAFKNLANLTRLDLSGNRLTVYSSGCDFFLPKFGYLLMRSCNLTKFPGVLGEQSSIQVLDLSRNRIQGLIPKWVWNNSYTTLNLSQNLLEGVEESMPGIPSSLLASMDLQSNRLRSLVPLPAPNSASNNRDFAGSIPSNIGVFIKEAKYFSLAKNDLTGEIPSSFCDATNLMFLDLSHNNLTGPLPSCLANMTSLATLNVQGNSLSGTIPHEFSSGCALEVINMNGNMLRGGVPDTLSNCQKLQLLDIGNNDIANPFPFWMGKLPDLKVLILRNNKFSGTLGETWNGSFSKLQILDLSFNRFIGSLPDDMFVSLRAMKTQRGSDLSSRLLINVTSMYYVIYNEDSITGTTKGRPTEFTRMLTIYNSLDLSNNGFEGQISDKIGELIALKALNLSGNHMDGQIPLSLGKLTQLESMDLSRNNISGKIPSELMALNFLAVLNLSYNQLEGQIPQGSQFNTFLLYSYIGNKGLCGPPVSENCGKQEDRGINVSQPTKELSWHLISAEVGFVAGLASWFGFLFSSPKSRIWLYKVSYEVQRKILHIFTKKPSKKVNLKK